MKFERSIREVGGSNTVTLPIDLCKFLQLSAGDEVIIQDDEGKHGRVESCTG